ncbi:hypothetical protein DSM106972_097930 [Dulcicalothrix desertica PCC 7102]|uniref:Uncharacterized protein n=1 Tax=Dulcicalothrix desertica PCC 7102 TaxID=232991 RepID=A0A433UGC2_9CYAN|nr:hypothetical protein [Dulcicalothrix desertica]RUS92868.1 hypothetical protein DSM106972_097930 [Dulcicalothrix desertica PCC 7102]
MICKNYIPVETRLIASLQRADFMNDLGLLYHYYLRSFSITTNWLVTDSYLQQITANLAASIPTNNLQATSKVYFLISWYQVNVPIFSPFH